MDAEGSTPGRDEVGPGSAPPAGELSLLLLSFFLEMRRGMEEFRRAYGMPVSESGLSTLQHDELWRRLQRGPEGRELWRELEAGIQEIKVHHAALLEGYHQATHEGSRKLLETLDPERLRTEFEGGKVQVGPIKIDCRWRPLLVQAIWEEYLRRFRQYRALESADFERFFRDGFRQGYRKFRDARTSRPMGSDQLAEEA